MTQINFQIDENIKENAENALNEIGITMSTALTMFLTKISQEHRIPFEISPVEDPFYSPENIARLERSAVQMEQTGGTVHEIGESSNG